MSQSIPRRIRAMSAMEMKETGGHALAASAMLIALLVFAATGCARNPVTGRPNAVLTTEEGEIRQGNEAAKLVEEHMGLVPDANLESYIDALGQRLAAHSPRTNLKHTLHVVEMKEPNAFALPGGHIYVSRGLLALCNSEDELAVVIGHEIGHVAARHSVQRQAANAPLVPVRIAAGLGGAITSIVSPSLGRVVRGIGQLPGALALATYSREQEREADRLGQQFAAASGFDPAALSSFMHSLSRDEELAGHDPDRTSFFQSHPSSPERSDDASSYAKELTIVPSTPAPLTTIRFFSELDGLAVGANAADGVFVDDRFLHPELRIGMRLPKDWKYINTRSAMVAQQKDKLAQLVLQIIDEGSDPMEAALVFNREIMKLDESPRRFKINGLDAVDAFASHGRGSNADRYQVTWISHGGRIYRVLGWATQGDFDAMLSKLDEAAKSFHVLKEAEMSEIRQDTLRIATARRKEGLEKLGQRTKNVWSVEQTAVANGLEEGVSPAAGAPVKIARPERYVPPAPLPESPAGAETEKK